MLGFVDELRIWANLETRRTHLPLFLSLLHQKNSFSLENKAKESKARSILLQSIDQKQESRRKDKLAGKNSLGHFGHPGHSTDNMLHTMSFP